MEVNTDNELCAEVRVRGSFFMESGQSFDCKFLVGAEPHQVVVAGHKLVLAMASPKFEAMFYGSEAEEQDPIRTPNIQPEIFKSFVRYIYTGAISLNSVEEACHLLCTASMYMMEHLQKKCSKYLEQRVNLGNVWRLYEHARLVGSPELLLKCEKVIFVVPKNPEIRQKRCKIMKWDESKNRKLSATTPLYGCEDHFDIISTNTKSVLNDSDFKNIAREAVMDVFSLHTLNIDNELDLVEAADRYFKAQNVNMRREEKGISLTQNDEQQPEKDSSTQNDERQPEKDSSTQNDERQPEKDSSTQNNERQPVKDSSTQNNESLPQKNVFEHDLKIKVVGNIINSPENKNVLKTQQDKSDEQIGVVSRDLETKDETTSFRKIIENISFLSLTPVQFAECLRRNCIMTMSEEYAVMMNIVSNNCRVPMPEGFSTCTVGRHRMIEVGLVNEDESRVEATFRYTIQDFKNVKDILSPACYVQNLGWQLHVTQEDFNTSDGQQQKRPSFSIRCSGLNNSLWTCNATTTLTFISQRPGESNSAVTLPFSYSSEKNTGCFLATTVAQSQDAKYLKEGAITLLVYIKAETPQEIHPKSSVWW